MGDHIIFQSVRIITSMKILNGDKNITVSMLLSSHFHEAEWWILLCFLNMIYFWQTWASTFWTERKPLHCSWPESDGSQGDHDTKAESGRYSTEAGGGSQEAGDGSQEAGDGSKAGGGSKAGASSYLCPLYPARCNRKFPPCLLRDLSPILLLWLASSERGSFGFAKWPKGFL